MDGNFFISEDMSPFGIESSSPGILILQIFVPPISVHRICGFNFSASGIISAWLGFLTNLGVEFLPQGQRVPPKPQEACSSNSLLGETRDPRSRLMVSLISLVSLIGTELETCQSYAQNTATISRVYALPNIWGNRRNKAYVEGTWAKPFYEVCMKKTQFPST